jgi:TRAP-type C4-dicarboxylate transport system substrate-binding protein
MMANDETKCATESFGRRLSLRSALGAAALALAACTLALPASAQQVLRAVSPWPKTFVITESLLEYIEKVNEAGKGVVQIQFAGGPEAIPANDQGGALRRGAIDMYYGSSSYLSGLLPEVRAFGATNRSVPELRANGGFDLLDGILQKKINTKFLSNPDRGWAFYMLVTKEPKLNAKGGLDLTGVRMRSHPLYNEFLISVGATPVVLQTTDIYTAFERGLVDGLAWPEIGAADFKIEKFVKHRVYPAFYTSDIVTLINLDKWKSLTPAAQKILMDVGMKHEAESHKKFEGLVLAEQKMLDAAGNKAFTLKGAGITDYLGKADVLPWSQIEKVDTTNVKALREKFMK